MQGSKPTKRTQVLIVGTLILSVCGVAVPSALSISTAQAASNSSGVSAKPVLDDDGDDMRYHWQNPAYAAEQMLQIGGIAVLMAVFGASAQIKKARREGRQ